MCVRQCSTRLHPSPSFPNFNFCLRTCNFIIGNKHWQVLGIAQELKYGILTLSSVPKKIISIPSSRTGSEITWILLGVYARKNTPCWGTRSSPPVQMLLNEKSKHLGLITEIICLASPQGSRNNTTMSLILKLSYILSLWSNWQLIAAEVGGRFLQECNHCSGKHPCPLLMQVTMTKLSGSITKNKTAQR